MTTIALFSSTLYASNNVVGTQAKELWRQIEFSDSESTFIGKYWGEVRSICIPAFLELIEQEGKMKENISFYVQQFGKTGATDIRWAIAAPTMALPESGKFRPTPGDSLTDHRLFFCECLVKRLITEPLILRRYYRLVFWRRDFLGKPVPELPYVDYALNNSIEGAKKVPKGYWWYARDFVILAHSVERDDLIQDLDSTNLLTKLIALKEWISNNKKKIVFNKSTFYWQVTTPEKVDENDTLWPLVSNVPRTPFPEWERLPLFCDWTLLMSD